MIMFIIFLMIVQVCLFVVGIFQLFNGSIGTGLFNVIINFVFFIVNIFNLKTAIELKY